jgi:hypothetical protein
MKTKKLSVGSALLVLLMSAYVSNAYAWDYSQAANSYCDINGNVAIWIRFTNAERLNSGRALHVIATDEQSGVSVDYGNIIAKDTQDRDLYTGMGSNKNGKVRFDIYSTGWDNGSETVYATYSGKVCTSLSPLPSPTATIAPTASASATPAVISTPEAGASGTIRTDVADSGNVAPVGGVDTAVMGVSTEDPNNSGKMLPSTGNGLWFGAVGGMYIGLFGYGLRKYARAV